MSLTTRGERRGAVPARALGFLLTCLAACTPATEIREDAPPRAVTYEPRPTGSLSFAEHVAPIVFAHCAPCHRPGEAAPFALLSYQDVRKRAEQIAEVTSSRYMPPWLPEAGHGAFAGERRLTDEQIGMLAQWAREGAPPGDLALTPPVPDFPRGWQLGSPDLVVGMPTAYTLRPEPGDVFRNFVLPVPIDRTRYVRSIEFRPDNLEVLHHATIAVDRTPGSRYHDALDEEVGFDGMINANARRPDGHLLGWVPGKLPFEGREDIAWRLDPGADLVVQLHMQPGGRPETVQPSIGLYFADAPPRRTAFLLRLGSMVLDIPAGEAAYEIRDTYVLPVDVDVLGLVPHAHYLARLMEGYATLPDGTRRWLIRIPDWDFNWQDEYRYSEPLRLPKGAALTMRFTYDNTSANVRNPHQPPRRVRYGSGSEDEMGDLWIQVLPVHDQELEILRHDFGFRDLRAQVAGARQLLEHDAGDYATRNLMGEMLQALGRSDEALEQFRRVVADRPGYALARSNLGSALAGAGLLEEAGEQYREAVRLETDLPELHYNLGQVLKRQGRLDEAVAAYRQALALRPGMARAHFVLGNALMAQGRTDGAIKHFREAASLDEQDVQARNNLGSALATAGRLEEATEQFRRAVEIDPGHARSHFNLGAALAAGGDREAAMAQFRATLELEPGHVQATRALERIGR